MKYFAVILAVCVALASASVFKRDTKATTSEINWEQSKQHINDMLTTLGASAKAMISKSADETVQVLQDFASAANKTLESYSPDLKAQVTKFTAFVESSNKAVQDAVKQNAPDVHNLVIDTSAKIAKQADELKALLGPKFQQLAADLEGRVKALEQSVHAQAGSHNH